MEKLGLPLRFPNCSPIADECTLYSVVWYLLYALFNSVPFNLTDTLHHDEANFSGLSPFLVVLVILVLKICWAAGFDWGCHQERKETWPMQHSEQKKAFEMYVAQRIFSSTFIRFLPLLSPTCTVVLKVGWDWMVVGRSLVLIILPPNFIHPSKFEWICGPFLQYESYEGHQIAQVYICHDSAQRSLRSDIRIVNLWKPHYYDTSASDSTWWENL